jgi:16S rRNA (guanine966-N2)-methyltransferase
MRIIAGTLKGRVIAGPDWSGLRPTSDKLRETLFNILGGRVDGASVMDVYAGTGALGLEALSRGAAFVLFVERDPRARTLIAENLRRCGVGDRCAMMRAVSDLRGRPAGAPLFDLILLDPPYAGVDPEPDIAQVAATLSPGGMVVFEHARRRPAPAQVGSLVRLREVVSGDSALAFYESRTPDTAQAGPAEEPPDEGPPDH